jgi:hypothetical protein
MRKDCVSKQDTTNKIINPTTLPLKHNCPTSPLHYSSAHRWYLSSVLPPTDHLHTPHFLPRYRPGQATQYLPHNRTVSLSTYRTIVNQKYIVLLHISLENNISFIRAYKG